MAPTVQCFNRTPFPNLQKYYNPGDFIIVGIISQVFMFSNPITFKQHPSLELSDDPIIMTQFYQHIVALAFAVKEVNENTKILPNISLGFHIYDGLFTASGICLASLQLLSKSRRTIPNYTCDLKSSAVAVIEGPNSEVDFPMATILSIYKMPQVIYGSTPIRNHNIQDSFFYWMFPGAEHQNDGILQLLLHFGWIWIGVLSLDDETSDRFVQNILPAFAKRGICFGFLGRFPKLSFSSGIENMVMGCFKTVSVLMKSTANVIIVHGEMIAFMAMRIFIRVGEHEGMQIHAKAKVWLMTAQIDFASFAFQRTWAIDFLQGALSFAIHSKGLVEFQKFLHQKTPLSQKEDGFIRGFWEEVFLCSFPRPFLERKYEEFCTGEEKLEDLPATVFEMTMTAHSYSIYNAVFALAHALHGMHSPKFLSTAIKRKKEFLHQIWQLHKFLRSISFNNGAGELVSFDHNGELVTGFDIINWVTLSNESFLRVQVGNIDPDTFPQKQLTIYDDDIKWPRRFNQVKPLSLCNEKCKPGFNKAKKEGEPFCCYVCLQCPDGKISNQMDMDYCFECSEDKYPNHGKTGCLPKHVTFLSYQEPLGRTLFTIATAFCFITATVFIIFLKYKNTPIVKANNRNLTYILLLSLLSCFASVFLFIGQPTNMTCRLRQTAFGMIFSVAVSCILAKTITVVMAFRVTKPGSSIKKWVGKRLSHSIVLCCSALQAAICCLWLAISPPFSNFNKHSLGKEIILECNEGSNVMFYCVLGFLGLLAIVSFTAAFLARKLPDTFNESKFITFSMVVFCSVWLSFVPTYVNTKGKYMVAVEIFSILSSSAGLLCCIFSPKCYIILVKPELNSKEQVTKRKD